MRFRFYNSGSDHVYTIDNKDGHRVVTDPPEIGKMKEVLNKNYIDSPVCFYNSGSDHVYTIDNKDGHRVVTDPAEIEKVKAAINKLYMPVRFYNSGNPSHLDDKDRVVTEPTEKLKETICKL